MTNINELIEQAINNHRELMRIVPYDPKVNFPDTISPGSIIKYFENETYIQWEHYNKHINVNILFWDDKDVPIIDLINKFIDEAKIRELDLAKAKPLPHITWSTVLYYPVIIQNNIPCRLLCVWLHSHNTYQISLDTIISTKTWRENKSLI